MKKLFLILASVTAISVTNSMAQDNTTDFRDKLSFGLKAGVNYSNVYDSKGEEFHASPKVGLAAGAFLAIPFGKYFGLQPEALISQKGFSATGRILGEPYKFTRTTTYVDLPLFFSLKPSEFFTIMAGPQYSYLIHQTDVFANKSTTIAQETEFENDNIRKNTVSAAVGFDLTMKHIVLSGRAGWDLQNNKGDGTSTTPRYKNAWYQATIGYRFYKN